MRRALLLGLVGVLAAAAPGDASPTQESTFQDDAQLLSADPARIARTLDTLAGLGVDRLRVFVVWKAVAPQPDADARPAFDATDPAAYPAAAWDRYDTLLRLAGARGLKVSFDLTGPAPDWATGTPERADIDPTWQPSADEFGQFVHAAGRRFPAVDHWGIWNEPNDPGSLTPQWVPEGRRWIEAAPGTYRTLADAAYAGLVATGHGKDTILVGETAAEGAQQRGLTSGLTPARFIRRLYCLDNNLQFLRGVVATRRGCPATPEPGAFVAAHPALFAATGWAHHPSEPTLALTTEPRDREAFSIANLGDLSRLLRRVRARYGQATPRPGVPLYLTAFALGVAPPRQAAYLALAEYLAWSNPRVRTLAQPLLVGDGQATPALEAYKFPVILSTPSVRRGSRLRIWGLVRPAPPGPATVSVLVAPGSGDGPFRKVGTAQTNAHGYLIARVRARRSGQARLAWRAPDGSVLESRTMRFHVRRR
jgi:hypothetical protein